MTENRTAYRPILVALLLVLGVAAGLRLARLSDLPLGLHYDEAANGILAAEIAQGEKHPIFIPSYTGKEVLFFYWAAAWMRAIGESVLALRLTSAVIGVCTVAAAAWSVFELFHHRQDRSLIALLTAAFLATSFWHLVLSRLGFRAITQPLLQALTVGALWRGLRLERRHWLILGGLLGGTLLYTYLAARAFPLVLGTSLLVLLIADGKRWRTRVKHIGVFALAAGVAMLPLVTYFIAHPGALTTRMGQVASRSWAEAWSGIRACLEMFFARGDPYIRFNLPYRPVFAPVTAMLFLAGVLLVAYHTSRPLDRNSPSSMRGSLPLASGVLLLILIPVMILPSALATGEITPSNLRAVGLLPFVYAFPAVAISSVFQMAGSRWQVRARRKLFDTLYLVVPLFLLAVLTPLTTRLYFQDWAPSPSLYEAADGDLADAAIYLNENDWTEITPYVASLHYRHPTIAFLAEDYSAVKWLTGGRTLVFPAEGNGLLILPRSADRDQAWIEQRLGENASLPTILGPDGEPAFLAYRIPAGPAPTPTRIANTSFGQAVSLLGYDLLGPSISGESVDVIIYWRVHDQGDSLPGDMLPAARLNDPWGGAWGETRPFHYPAEQWDPGEVILDHLSVNVTPGAPPGAYRLLLTFFAASTGANLPLLDPSGAYAGIGLEMPVSLERATAPPDPTDLLINQRLDLDTGSGLILLGANLDTPTVRPGEPVLLTLFWQTDRAPEADMRVRLDLGQAILYEDGPVHNSYPTSYWTSGEIVIDRYNPQLDREVNPGTYPLNLSLVDTAGNMLLEPVSLGEITIEATDRVFEPPPMEHSLGIPLGGQVELLGYDLTPDNPLPGEQVTITLYWQAMTEMEPSYTVFVHLLGAGGSVPSQHDSVPVNGAYPTNLWVPGEVVADLHLLDLPADLSPGTHSLEVGMYIVETGVRLAVPGSADGAVVLTLSLDPPSPE